MDLLGDASATVDTTLDDAALDQAADDTQDDHGAQDTDGAQDSSAQDDQTAQDDQQQSTADADGKALPLYKQAKSFIAEVQKTNPTLAAKIKGALIAEENFKRELPEGVKTFTAIRDALAGLGDKDYDGLAPDKVIEQAKSELAFWRTFDSDFSAGDPKVLDKLIEVSPDAFLRLAPEAIGRFASVNPEGFSSYISQVMLQDMNSAGIPVQFEILKAFLPNMPEFPGKEKVLDAVNAIFGFTEKFKALAQKPIVPAKKAENNDEKTQQREQQIAQREMEVTRKAWNIEAVPFGTNLVRTEVARLAGKKQVTDIQSKQILSKVAEELDARLAANGDYGKAMRAFLQSGNQDGYKRRLHSEYQKLIPGAVRRAYDDVVGASNKSAPVKAAAGQPDKKPVANTGKATPGITRIAQYPNGRVDVKRTSPSMLAKNQAILKDGSHVTWPGR